MAPLPIHEAQLLTYPKQGGWKIGPLFSFTAYDAAYVALAEALDAPLLTCDRRLASARGHAAEIDLVT